MKYFRAQHDVIEVKISCIKKIDVEMFILYPFYLMLQ